MVVVVSCVEYRVCRPPLTNVRPLIFLLHLASPYLVPGLHLVRTGCEKNKWILKQRAKPEIRLLQSQSGHTSHRRRPVIRQDQLCRRTFLALRHRR